MYGDFKTHVAAELAGIEEAGLTKRERGIRGPQSAEITADGTPVLNFCANNYLGLADDPGSSRRPPPRCRSGDTGSRASASSAAPRSSIWSWSGAWRTSSGRTTRSSTRRASTRTAGVRDALLGGGRDHLGRAQPRVDHRRDPALKARRLRYRNRDMADLEEQLRAAADARFRVVVTDGVFSMDGYIAPLAEICDLAERYDALVFVDDSHAVGFVGEHGRGTPELCGCRTASTSTPERSARRSAAPRAGTWPHADIVALLRQRSRPYLFSNTVAPAIVAGTLTALDLVEDPPSCGRDSARTRRCSGAG